MILAIGTDIVEVSRVERAMRNPRFLLRILTERELEANPTPLRVAGRWAAKEAIAKCFGRHLRWHQVEILNDATGSPIAILSSTILDASRMRLHLSISHEKQIAVATAILEAL